MSDFKKGLIIGLLIAGLGWLFIPKHKFIFIPKPVIVDSSDSYVVFHKRVKSYCRIFRPYMEDDEIHKLASAVWVGSKADVKMSGIHMGQVGIEDNCKAHIDKGHAGYGGTKMATLYHEIKVRKLICPAKDGDWYAYLKRNPAYATQIGIPRFISMRDNLFKGDYNKTLKHWVAGPQWLKDEVWRKRAEDYVGNVNFFTFRFFLGYIEGQ